MNKHYNAVSTGVACATQTQVPPQLKPLLKVALDVHLAFYVVASPGRRRASQAAPALQARRFFALDR
jgi:hypothetical protein